MVLDLLPLHRQIRTCHGFIRSLVNDGGNTGGGSRQRRTVGDKSRFPTSAATQILRVYVCVCIHIVGYWCLFRKIEMPNESHRGEARCDAKLTRRRLGALACLLAGEYYLLYRIVAWSSMMETGRAAFRQIRRVYRIRYFSDDSASIYWWREEGGKINVEKYRFTVYLFTQVYETWDERMRRNLKFESVELDGIYINIYRLARILLARSSIRSFIYRLGYSISLLDSFSFVILITMKN